MLNRSIECREIHPIVDAVEVVVEAVANGGYHFTLEVVEPVHVEISEGSEETEGEVVGP